MIATGVSHSVRELVEIAFAHAGLDWQKFVRIDPALMRPAEVDHLLGILYPMRITDFSKFGYTEVMFPDMDPNDDD